MTEYSQLEAGYEFPPGNFKLDAETVARYLKATDDSSPFFSDGRLAPPMAAAALALASLSNTISLPPGTIHVSQELGFSAALKVGDELTSYAKVSRVQKRAKLHIIGVDFDVRSADGRTVLTGVTSFLLPASEGPQEAA